MSHKINPRVDLAFKKIFGTEGNKDLLISLINSIVGEEDQVVDVTLLNPYNQKNFKKDKLSILDIKAEGSDGKKFNIEIQIADEADYDKRALYYWAKLYTDQLKEKEDYGTLEKVIGIHILNFTSILDSEKYHNAFHITEKETGLHYFKELELHTIELKKFKDTLGKEFEDIGSKIQNSLDLWSAFLLRNDLISAVKLPQSLDDVPVKKAIDVLNVMNFSDDEREIYEGQLKWLRIEANSLKKAEEKGREEGREERDLEIARALLKQGLATKQISAATGLSEEEVKKLQDAK
jgi:predicted transposase/invertase (TIGR01784 family)